MRSATGQPIRRRFALSIVLLLTVVALPATAMADGGLPELASVQAGPFTAGIFDNAPTLVTGSNTLTVQIAALPDHHTVNLTLDGPHSQRLEVPLRPVQVLDGSSDMHAGHGADHDMQSMSDMAGMSGGSAAESSAYLARGSVVVPEAGPWEARLLIRKSGGESFVGQASLVAQDAGPNAVYLGVVGAVIGGSLIYGMWLRHRQRSTNAVGPR